MNVSLLIPFFFVIGAIVAFLLVLRPDWGLLFLIFMLYTRLSDIMINYFDLPSIAKIYIPFLGLVILIRWLVFFEKPRHWGIPATVLAGYGFLAVLSILHSNFPSQSQAALILFMKDAIAIVAIVLLMRNEKDLYRVIWTLLFAGIFMGSISTYQFITGTFERNYFGFGQAIFESGLGYYRISGLGIGFNAYSQRLLILVPLSMDRLWSEEKGLKKFFASWAFLVVVLTVVFTYSRGAFLGLVIVLSLSLLFITFRKQLQVGSLILVLIVGIFIIQFLPAQYLDRLATISEFSISEDPRLTDDSSIRGRYSENLAAWRMFLDNPILGIGLNNYKSHYLEYSRDIGLDPRLEGRSPHSLYLEILSELGFLGILWFFALQWFAFRGLYFAYQKFESLGKSSYANISVSFGVALIGYLIAGIFLHVSHSRFFWLLYAIALSIPIVANNAQAAEQSLDSEIGAS